MSEPSTRPAAAAPSTVDLQVGGMTCASCAARIERKLNRMPGVSASVNYATGTAHVELPVGTEVDDAIATVEATGYRARLPRPADAPTPETASDPEDVEVGSLRRRLVVSAALTLPVLVLAMVPFLQFTYWQWLSLTLAAPVVVWGAWPFHLAAWTNARHRAATMDTLISVGVSAAFGWSLYALFFGGAACPAAGWPDELRADPAAGRGRDGLYLELRGEPVRSLKRRGRSKAGASPASRSCSASTAPRCRPRPCRPLGPSGRGHRLRGWQV